MESALNSFFERRTFEVTDNKTRGSSGDKCLNLLGYLKIGHYIASLCLFNTVHIYKNVTIELL